MMTLMFIFVGLPAIGFVIYQVYATFRDAPRPGALGENAASTGLASSSLPQHGGSTRPVLGAGGTDPVIGWNVAVIVFGSLIGLIGLGAWLLADPTNSALRQTVAALWLIAGLLGFVVAAVGVLGASLVHVLRRVRP
jgi:hypothetical protein